MINRDLFCEISEDKAMEINGGIAPAIVAALIAAGVTIIGAGIKMDMDNAVNCGESDAYNDIKNNTIRDMGTPIYHF